MSAPIDTSIDHPTAGRFEGRAHLLPVRVYYEDTDFTGLVYHANYVRYLERGRSDFLRLTASGHTELLNAAEPMAFVVAELNLKYLKPARIDDALVVRTTYDAIKGPRLMISQTVERDGDVLCRAAVTAVCIHLDGRPRRPTKALVDSVTPWLAPAPAAD
ncbi:tol-pal system-associated acyl-CoA thioesterase [soil metagenome]